MVKIRGIIFDLDDTLYCEHDYVRSGFCAVAQALAEANGQDATSIYDAFVQEWQENGRGKVFDTVCERLHLFAEVADLVRIYRMHEPISLSLYEDADRLLSYLQKHSIARGLITDGDKRVQWRKIKALRLEERIPCIIVSDDLGRECWKPSRVPYEKALTCLGLAPAECAYVGDNPHKDFCTARALGMHTIRVVRPVGDHMSTRLTPEMEAERIVYSLEEIMEDIV
ncbi:HAD family hydrolase [Aneurinibacillus danicus]|uniref:Haloacid dehalogenase n=1 Tax=Aneurinibacillus danicus TaxID=267746 RepID=A0A511VB87_9BACL|nr:HAD family hydrolase [Aneurinibacillus danicus]GEN36197.1 haloacid dehalogenase [Aneurinibacillus danicus]